MARPQPVRLALDHNFPTPILAALAEYIVDIELDPLPQIDHRLPGLDDRELVIALHQLGYPGLVTNNYKMLKNPRELAAIIATRLTVFAIEGVGHDPIRATGALLLDLPGALQRLDTRKAQVFWMRPRNPRPEDPMDLFERAAEHQHRDPGEFLSEVEVTPAELADGVLR
ncbi:MAG: hypothetical protein H0X61_09440 [Acidimicrobiia bacterium]|jgi:hypothetical protein|nr:hypothetical protein [Acidimicrobiia bacterium]